tara:strand:- start:198 stop:620 length:423 start_codon:yes stop_codon:yes gene_type:complete
MAAMNETRAAYIYTSVLDQAFDDDVISSDEAVILEVIADSLGLSESMRQAAWRTVLRDGIPDSSDEMRTVCEGEMDLYEDTVRAALADTRITGDEYAILGRLRSILDITDDDHSGIEDRLRESMNDTEHLFQFLDSLDEE